jgi:flagellar biogenesis protein FliO
MMDYLRLIFILGAVLILAYVVVRHLLPRVTGMKQVTSGPMQVAARLPLEPGKNLYIIKAGSLCFLVGTAGDNLHYLTSLDPEAIGAGSGEPEQKPAEFGSLLRNLRGSRD